MTRLYLIHPLRGQGRPGEWAANKATVTLICRRERIWFSPHCLVPTEFQPTLFASAEVEG